MNYIEIYMTLDDDDDDENDNNTSNAYIYHINHSINTKYIDII